MYEEFAASFASDDSVPGGKAFVRGGVVEPGSRPSSNPSGARASIQGKRPQRCLARVWLSLPCFLSAYAALTTRPSSLPLANAAGDKKVGTKYVPSFLPPSSKKEEPVSYQPYFARYL